VSGRLPSRINLAALWVFVAPWLVPALAAQTGADAIEFFETKVRPVLAENCFACHTSTKLGGLEMSSRNALIAGGNSGPAIEPGHPERSLLLKAVRHTHERLKMPPQGKLSDERIDDLAVWIRDGAVWPDAPLNQAADDFQVTEEHRRFWAFQPVRPPAPPKVRNRKRANTPIDRYIVARLEEKGLAQAPPADKRTLLRRAYLDLTGLPPTPEQVRAFIQDNSHNAFVRVVDKLLASPRYGERWGRYWLDVARYSDDKLNSTQMEPYPHAYRYRDWVIKAFNDDMPYDLFVKAQIAGDFLEDGKNPNLVAGLAFYGLSPQFQDDRIDVTGRGFLGLTVQCAQCHDHKFDPIPTEDYYALLGVFNNSKVDEFPLAGEKAVADYKEKSKEIAFEQKQLKEFLGTQARQLAEVLAGNTAAYLEAVWNVIGPRKRDVAEVSHEYFLDEETLDRWARYLGGSPRDHPLLDRFDDFLTDASPGRLRPWATEMEALVLDVLREKRKIDKENEIRLGGEDSARKANEVEMLSLERDRHFLWRDMGSAQAFDAPVDFKHGVLYYPGDEIGRFLPGVWRDHADRLRTKIEKLEDVLPEKYPFLHVLHDKDEPKNEHVHIRGSKDNLGAEVPRRFLTILGARPFQKGSGRLELAESIASPENPLTARVMVNRIWLNHFGRGLVNTPSNFGQMGERPSHPELLDYLAARFVEGGWSIKALHREIMLSATYALSSTSVKRNEEVDSDNRLLWRANRRRLDVETLRDSLLKVAGNLDLTPGGEPSLVSDAANHRRTVYAYVSRRKLDKSLGLFDFPNPNQTSPQRIGTNTPLQGLFFLNSEFVMRQAERLTDRLLDEAGQDDVARIRRAYSLVYGRAPTKDELAMGRAYLKAEPNAWPSYAQALLSSNEFLYIQ
jgi:mono/diheme cytochrome c family protein